MKTITRVTTVVAGALALALTGGMAAAQDWPAKPILWLVPTPPGGALDMTARLLQEPVSKILGQPIVVENRTGGAGLVATEATIRAQPDGYTFGMMYSAFATNTALLPNAKYDTTADFAPVAYFWRAPSAISVHPSQPYKSLKELIEAVKAKPGSIGYGTPGVGSSMHIAGALLSLQAKAEFQHVPYRGAGPALADAVAGNVPMSITNVASSAPQAKEGKLRPLAVTGPRRSALLPDVPTVAELGFPDFSVTEWFVLVAPAKTPDAIAEKMNAAIRQALEQPAVKERYAQFGFDYQPMTRAEVGSFLKEETAKLTKIIKDAGIKAE